MYQITSHWDKQVSGHWPSLKDFNVESHAGSVELNWGKLGDAETKNVIK